MVFKVAPFCRAFTTFTSIKTICNTSQSCGSLGFGRDCLRSVTCRLIINSSFRCDFEGLHSSSAPQRPSVAETMHGKLRAYEPGTLSVSFTQTISMLSLQLVKPISYNSTPRFDVQWTTLWSWRRLHMQPCCPYSRQCNLSKESHRQTCRLHWAYLYTLNSVKDRSRASLSIRQSLSRPVDRIGWMHIRHSTAATHAKIAVSLPINNAPILPSCSRVQVEKMPCRPNQDSHVIGPTLGL